MNEYEATSPSTSSVASSAAEIAGRSWETTKDKASQALHSGEQYVRDNPGTSVLGVFGTGLIVGLLIGWSVAHQERRDYSDDARRILDRLARDLKLS